MQYAFLHKLPQLTPSSRNVQKDTHSLAQIERQGQLFYEWNQEGSMKRKNMKQRVVLDRAQVAVCQCFHRAGGKPCRFGAPEPPNVPEQIAFVYGKKAIKVFEKHAQDNN